MYKDFIATRDIKNYRTIHYQIERMLGKPNKCTTCGTTSAKRYHWANISKEYKVNKEDWIRLCVPCHSLFDRDTTCKNGHLRTPANTYKSPTHINCCRICRSNYRKEYRKKYNK